jgi:predicted ArsR family transcriptional regulator
VDVHVAQRPTAGAAAVLDAVLASRAPRSATELAGGLGLHANTVRGHLEVLVRRGAVRREIEPRTVRGRPRVLYSAAAGNPHDPAADPAGLGEPSAARPPGGDTYRTLATALALELAYLGAADQRSADAAGAAWAHSLVSQGRLRPAATADAAVRQVAEVFDELGFDPATEPLGDRLYLRACPYAEQVAAFPGICQLHLGLLRAAFAAAGGQVAVPAMAVQARPGLCVAQLQQPPAATASGPASGPQPAPGAAPRPPTHGDRSGGTA